MASSNYTDDYRKILDPYNSSTYETIESGKSHVF